MKSVDTQVDEGDSLEKQETIDTGWDAVLNDNSKQKAPYFAKVIENIDNGKGYWQYQRIGVFDRGDHLLGSYVRNYDLVFRTFHPFKLKGEWLSLYSKDYTATRIMSLPSCEDLGGEEPASGGFCPVDYYVPTLHKYETITHDPPCNDAKHCTIKHKADCPSINNLPYNGPCTCSDLWREHYKMHDVWTFPERVHGFVAGCVWGDDSSWKIQYLDLSEADKGILKRDERFGYIELGNDTLEDAIKFNGDYLIVSVLQRFRADGSKMP